MAIAAASGDAKLSAEFQPLENPDNPVIRWRCTTFAILSKSYIDWVSTPTLLGMEQLIQIKLDHMKLIKSIS